jgi:predicted glycosyltransferase
VAAEPAGGRRLRVLLYGQHLSGVGHYVRLHEIARELARHHEAHLVQGGRPVPRARATGIHDVTLPALVRRDGRIVLLDAADGHDTGAVLRERALRLDAALGALQPDVLVVEYYPFSRWDSQDEILGLLASARARCPGIRIVCSVRDIPRRSGWDDPGAAAYAERVLELLHRHYDGVMVHADPRRSPFAASFPAVDRIRIPIVTTGIVAERCVPDERAVRAIRERTGGVPFVLASAGGGADPGGLLGRVADAWPRVCYEGPLAGHALVLATGLATEGDWPPARVAALRRRLDGTRALVADFSVDFLQWMRLAAASVSCAGYNTCANVLETRTPAVLVPSPAMPDQHTRAAFVARHAAIRNVPADADAEALAGAIIAAATGPRLEHDFDLDGAAGARRFVESLVAAG